MSLAPDAATVEAEAQTAHHGVLTRTGWIGLAAVVVVAILASLVVSEFWLSQILTKALWLGLAASSLIFLSAYGGMVSLGQVAIYGTAGMTYANLVAADGGNAAAWSPWLAVIGAIVVATAVGLLFGFIASRSEGIYFLMLTLAFSVLVYYFFSQVTQLSGFGGVNNLDLPGLVGDPGSDPAPLYFTSLFVCVALYLWMRYVARTPFGLSMQGLRDEPARMRALGFNVRLHRTLAFTFAAFIAAFAGILAVWYNRRISPGSINLGQTIDILDHRRHRRPVPDRGRLGGGARVRAAGQLLARMDAGDRQRAGPRAVQHAARDHLPDHRPRLARRPRRRLGVGGRPPAPAKRRRWRTTNHDHPGA